MGPLAEVLHGLVDAVAHLIPANRAGELHALADEVEAVLKAVEAPPAPPAKS